MEEAKKKDKNIYRLIREELCLSRSEAADLVASIEDGRYASLDENRLVKIENGLIKSIDPDDIVALSKAYNKPELRNYYCCHQCAIGVRDIPEVDFSCSIHEILVNMAVNLKSVNHSKIRLMEILEDGRLTEDEQEDFDNIYEELDKISMTVEALQLWCEKMKIQTKKQKDEAFRQ